MSAGLSELGQRAVDYASKGVAVFPCVEGSKRPRITAWPQGATCNVEAVRRHWLEHPSDNIGWVPHLRGRFILDVDTKAGKTGAASLARLQNEHGDLPPTLVIQTPSGGLHYVYTGQAKTSADKGGKGCIAPGLDIRGGRGDPSERLGLGYGLLPPSRTPEGVYTVQSGGAVATAPAWLTNLANSIGASSAPPTDTYDGPMDTPANVKAARAFLAHRKPAVEGDGGDAWTFETACFVLDYGLSYDKALELLEAWNATCDPPWPSDGPASLETKLRSALNRQNKGSAPLAGGDPVATFADSPAVVASLATEIPTRDPARRAYGRPLTAPELAKGDFPRATWLMEGFILEGHVNLIYGDGGVGKTMAALHMAVATAAGLRLWGRTCRQRPVLIVLAEDDQGETKARLGAICGLLGVDLAALPLNVWCLPGEDLRLASITDAGDWTAGPFLAPLKAELERIGECLLILDTVSDIATLDESKRLAVNTLCKLVLAGELCRPHQATVLVTAHPSKASMLDRSGYSGSTAWNNAVRNRLTMEAPDDDANSARRVLRNAKTNYGQGSELELWLIGMTLAPAGETVTTDRDDKKAVLDAVASMIKRDIRVVRDRRGSGQTPADVAKKIAKDTNRILPTKRVSELLNELEREGALAYAHGGNQERGQKAGFYLPEAA